MVSEIGQKIKRIRKAHGFTQEYLAKKTGVPYSTLTKLESGIIKNPSLQVVQKIAGALEIESKNISGVSPAFSPDKNEQQSVQILKGKMSIPKLLDDIYETLKHTGGEVLIWGVDERKFMSSYGPELEKQIKRLSKSGIQERLLVREGDIFLLSGKQSIYKWVPESMFNPTLFYVYADKLALVLWGPARQVVILKDLAIADAYRKQFLFIWDKAKTPMTKRVNINERSALEQNLMKRFGGKISSITNTEKDKKIFRDFLTKEKNNTYGNSFYYLCQAANGSGKDKLGLKYFDGETLIAIGIFNRSSLGGGWHYFLNRPLGKFDPHKLLNIAKSLYELSAKPVFIKKVTIREQQELLKMGFSAIEEYPWHAQALEEDDTYPEQIINVEDIVNKVDAPGKRNLKNQYKYFLRKAAGKKIEFADLNNKNAADALWLVEKFFDYLEIKTLHISQVSDYDNIISCPPLGKNGRGYFAQLVYINEKPVAFFAVEPLHNETTGLYANITLHEEYPNLSEYLLIEICRKLKKNGFKYLNLGGSETPGLFQFKEKFSPVAYNKMHWVVYKI